MGALVSLFAITCELFANDVHDNAITFEWGTEDTSLTFAQTFYYWGRYRNKSSAIDIPITMKNSKISFYLRVDSAGEFKLADSYFSDDINDNMLRRNTSRFVLRGTSTHYKLANISRPVKALIIARSYGSFKILDSTRSTTLYPIENDKAKEWLDSFDKNILGLQTKYQTINAKEIICKDALSSFRLLNLNAFETTFEPYIREKIAFNCGQIVNSNGVSNRNWQIFRAINACSIGEKIRIYDLKARCSTAYQYRNNYIRNLMHIKTELRPYIPIKHRFTTDSDTLEILEGTWYGNLKENVK